MSHLSKPSTGVRFLNVARKVHSYSRGRSAPLEFFLRSSSLPLPTTTVETDCYAHDRQESSRCRALTPSPEIFGDRIFESKQEALMSPVKDEMIRIIQQQPDDSSFDEILRELGLVRIIDRGLEDSKAGRTVSDAEMKRQMNLWRK